MELEHLLRRQPKRINPFQGLLIDVPTWTEAHEYHLLLYRLHALALHRPGIIAGLAVTAWNPADNSLVVHPGVALDPEGNLIMVPEEHRLHIEPRGKVLTHIILEYREVPHGSAEPAQGGERQPTHIMHAYRVRESSRLPPEPHLELARILASGRPPMVIRDAADPLHPGANEIDWRYRLEAGPQRKGHIKVGQITHGTPEQWDTHGRGLQNLVEAVGRFSDYSAELVSPVDLGQATQECPFLVINGTGEFRLDDGEVAALKAFLDSGGVLLGEACRRQGDDTGAKAFDVAYARLAERVGRRLRAVGKGHPLFNAYYLFGDEPPALYGTPVLLEEGGLVFSGSDYGCLWAGGDAEKPAPREAIRSALELGINLAVYALERAVSARLRRP